jgi:IMP cyclohydrolase
MSLVVCRGSQRDTIMSLVVVGESQRDTIMSLVVCRGVTKRHYYVSSCL